MEKKVKIMVADDHQLVRQGFIALLGTLDFVEFVGEAANGKQVLSLMRSGARPDVILMDMEMPGMNGLEATEEVLRDFFGTKVIMVTMLNDRAIIEQAVAKGVKGFLFKNAAPHELAEAIRQVANGGAYFSGEVTLSLLQPAAPSTSDPALATLTEREIEILRLVAEGLSSVEIGQQLFISPRTVDTHRNHLIQKLDVNGIAGLVRFAMQHKLV